MVQGQDKELVYNEDMRTRTISAKQGRQAVYKSAPGSKEGDGADCFREMRSCMRTFEKTELQSGYFAQESKPSACHPYDIISPEQEVLKYHGRHSARG